MIRFVRRLLQRRKRTDPRKPIKVYFYFLYFDEEEVPSNGKVKGAVSLEKE